MKKTIKKSCMILLIVLTILLFIGIQTNSRIKTQKQYSDSFIDCKESFTEMIEKVYEIAPETYTSKTKEDGIMLHVNYENDCIFDLTILQNPPFDNENSFAEISLKKELSDRDLVALDKINRFLNGKFEFINCFENYVYFGGDSTKAVVFSSDGSKPYFFFYEDDNVPFSIYKLDNQWYYLIQNIR